MPALVREACLHAQVGAGEAGQLTQASAQRVADALRGHAERLREDGAALDVRDSLLRSVVLAQTVADDIDPLARVGLARDQRGT
eukprot:12835265-Alexandrium_andersonii.AAC.1